MRKGDDMGIFKSIITNHVIIAPILTWAFSQIIKTVLYLIKEKKFDIKRIVGDGGMPSAHSATVVTLAIMAGYTEGFGSAIFAVGIIFAAVVIRDAVGVRREVGKHARVIKALNDSEKAKEIDEFNKLKLISGHSILEVILGILFGILMSIAYILIVF